MHRAALDYYFERFGFSERQILARPHPDLGLIVVIPCCNEPDLIGALESLWACLRPRRAVEVLVVINSSASAAAEVLKQNERTFDAARHWARTHDSAEMTLHVLSFPELPSRRAGVGLARKLGMDEAVARFGNSDCWTRGVIACFDADCRCAPTYLTSLEQHFDRHPNTPGCSIYFEHPLAGELDPAVYEAVVLYELHLRYYVQALCFAGFPCAFHTVGSSMAVRADAYVAQGGMNKRQAGEDFYFLQKIMAAGKFTELNETCVMPSPRPSNRVPFGTGRAVEQITATGQWRTYPLQAFLDLKGLFESVQLLFQEEYFAGSNLERSLSQPLRRFLEQEQFAERLQEIRQNTRTGESFRRRFFGSFNAFQVMKCVHFLRDQAYGEGEVAAQSAELLRRLGDEALEGRTPRELLDRFRVRDRGLRSGGIFKAPSL